MNIVKISETFNNIKKVTYLNSLYTALSTQSLDEFFSCKKNQNKIYFDNTLQFKGGSRIVLQDVVFRNVTNFLFDILLNEQEIICFRGWLEYNYEQDIYFTPYYIYIPKYNIFFGGDIISNMLIDKTAYLSELKKYDKIREYCKGIIYLILKNNITNMSNLENSKYFEPTATNTDFRFATFSRLSTYMPAKTDFICLENLDFEERCLLYDELNKLNIHINEEKI